MNRKGTPARRRPFPPLLFLPLLAWGAALAAETPASELDSILAKMERAEGDVQTISFQFVQTADIPLTGEQQKIKGLAYFKKPNRFRIEHKSPESRAVVSDGKSLWYYSPSQNQVFVDTWENWVRSAGFPKGLLLFQLDVKELRKKYSISFEGKKKAKSGETVLLKLSPLEPGPWSYVFRVWVDSASALPVRTELESSSVKAVTEVSQTKINPVLADSLFTLEIPKGTDVFGLPLEKK